jgi:hypothetical protein
VEHLMTLPAAMHAPVEARRALARVPGVSGELGYKALLLTSEVVTVWVLRAQAAERVRVEIADDESRDDAPHVGAYARRILERFADRWGVEGDGRAAIWFELDRGRRVTASGSAPGTPR